MKFFIVKFEVEGEVYVDSYSKDLKGVCGYEFVNSISKIY